MEALTRYRQVIRDLIAEYAKGSPSSVGEVRSEVIIDEKQDHYELIYAGWVGNYRVHGSILHIDIRDGKIWIESDGTHDGVADRLVDAGIPKDKIVLGYKHPSMRQHTDFAVA